MNYDKYLSNIFFNDDWHLNLSYLNKYKRHYKKRTKYQNIINYIENRYDDSESFKETLYRIKHNCEIRPVCKTCGNTVKFIGKNHKLYADFCSNKCSGVNKETILKKQEQDRKKHNGLLGWNKNTPEKIQARKDSLIKKYGSWETACKEIEKLHKEGVKRKYGVNSVMDIDEFKIKRNITIKNKFIYNHSKPEDEAYNLLSCYFDNVIRQYVSKEYPWACDFYIIDIDTYIECHFSHFHNFKPYIGNDEDKKEIKILQQKSNEIKKKTNKIKTQYDVIIYTWSDLDVRKRDLAKQNNLNYLEFYNLNDLKQWINQKKDSS